MIGDNCFTSIETLNVNLVDQYLLCKEFLYWSKSIVKLEKRLQTSLLSERIKTKKEDKQLMFRPWWWSARSGEGFDPDLMREAVSYPHPPPHRVVHLKKPPFMRDLPSTDECQNIAALVLSLEPSPWLISNRGSQRDVVYLG